MLKIKTHHSFDPFHANHGGRNSLEFSPVLSEDDELIQAIEEDANRDVWTLSPAPDTEQLASFWTSVEQDIHSDPEWVQFSEE